jgi:acyl carrier protein
MPHKKKGKVKMHTAQSIEDKLIKFICSNFMVEPDEFNNEDSLVDQGVIDSIGLVEISAFMNREFGIEESEENMTRENFGSVKKMVAFIVSKETR